MNTLLYTRLNGCNNLESMIVISKFKDSSKKMFVFVYLNLVITSTIKKYIVTLKQCNTCTWSVIEWSGFVEYYFHPVLRKSFYCFIVVFRTMCLLVYLILCNTAFSKLYNTLFSYSLVTGVKYTVLTKLYECPYSYQIIVFYWILFFSSLQCPFCLCSVQCCFHTASLLCCVKYCFKPCKHWQWLVYNVVFV